MSLFFISAILFVMQRDYAEILGWYGVGAILVAYGLVSFGFTTVNNSFFQLLNLTGAIGIVIDAYRDKNYQPVVLNLVWATIAILALLKIHF